MTFIQSIILGIVQGITEFLPISSSAHLVLIPYLLNWRIPEDQLFPFDVLVQMGTFVALLYYYREDIWIILKAVLKGIFAGKPFAEVEARIGWLTLLASVPAGFFGIAFRKAIKTTFINPALTAVFLFITAALLVAAESFSKRNREIETLNWKDALWIGSFQALSLLPGISRSGSTITGGMTRNLNRKTAGQFSFLMALPALGGAGIVGIIEMLALPDTKSFLPVMATGFLVAGVVGFFAISWLMKYITSHSLLPFAGYCLFLGAGSLLLLTLNPQNSLNATASTAVNSEAVYQVDFQPELEWLLPVMNNCQQELPEQEFIYQPAASISAAGNSQDVYFSYGLPEGNPQFVYQIGEDHLELVIHPSNSLQQIPLPAVDSLFAGRIPTWQNLAESCAECFSNPGSASNLSIVVWTLPEDTLPGSQFRSHYLNSPVSSLSKFAPTSRLLRQMIAADVNAIGVLPAGWVDGSVKILAINPDNWSPPAFPIIAVTPVQPDANLSLWLACVQKSTAR